LTPNASSRANWTLALLFSVFVFNFLDRQIFVILIEPIKQDLSLSDTQIGFLSGTAFALFHTVAAIPLGRISDLYSRKLVISTGLAAWSIVTMLHGVAYSVSQLTLARILVGVGESSSSPPSHSLIADLFPPQRRGLAISIYAMGSYVGIGGGLALGGYLSDLYHWRTVFMIVGFPGILLAVIFYFAVAEPKRGGDEADSESPPPMREALGDLIRNPALRNLVLCTSFFVFTANAIGVWGPSLLIRAHDLSRTQVGGWLGGITALCGAAGLIVSGVAVDRLSQKDRRWFVWLPSLGAVLSIPAGIGFAMASSFETALMYAVPMTFFGSFFLSPTHAAVQTIAPVRTRSLASGATIFTLSLLGVAAGPQVGGVLTDLLTPTHGDDAIRLAIVACHLSIPLGLLFAWRASRALSKG
jgi:MFS family permease